MKKNFLLFCASFLGLALLVFVGFFFLADWYTRSQISFFHKENLKLEPLDNKKMKQLESAYKSCFDDVRRKNLKRYYAETQSLEGSQSKAKLDKNIDKYLEKEGLEGQEYLKSLENATFLSYHDEIIGFYTCSDEETAIENSTMIWNVCLHEKMRGKGIGDMIIESAIKSCQASGKTLSLVVNKDDLRSQSLYKKHGFSFKQMDLSLEDSFQFYNKFLMIYDKK